MPEAALGASGGDRAVVPPLRLPEDKTPQAARVNPPKRWYARNAQVRP
jgi:hypothetical protein